MAIKPAHKEKNEQAPVSEQEMAVMQGQVESDYAVTTAVDVPLGGISGDIDEAPMRLPYLKVSSAMGKLEQFPKGSIVLGDEHLLAPIGKPVRLTILAAQIYWKEYIGGKEYNPNIVPKRFRTKAEVLAEGGTTEWSGPTGARVAPTYKQAIACKVFIEKPDEVVCGLFGVPLGDRTYAAALWDSDKTAASSVIPIIKSDAVWALRSRGLYAGIYELSAKIQKFNSGYSAAVPVLKLVGYHDDEIVKQIESLFQSVGGGTVDIEEGATS